MAIGEFTNEEFITAVLGSRSFAEISEKIGISPRQSNKFIKKQAKILNISLTHLDGQKVAQEKMKQRIHFEDSEIFIENSKANSDMIKNRILRKKLIPYRCCNNITYLDNIPMWNSKPLILQLDHINGVHTDNRLENLRWLCANCHTQTNTFAGRNRENALNKAALKRKSKLEGPMEYNRGLPLEDRKCPTCEITFHPKRSSTQYCSVDCANNKNQIGSYS